MDVWKSSLCYGIVESQETWAIVKVLSLVRHAVLYLSLLLPPLQHSTESLPCARNYVKH